MSRAVVSQLAGDQDGAATQRVRVLVADDYPAMRRAMARLVSEHDSLDLVGEANDGHEALGMIAATAPDVALLDVRMSKLDGLGLLRRLRAEGARRPRAVDLRL